MKKSVYLTIIFAFTIAVCGCKNRYERISPAIVPDLPQKIVRKPKNIDDMKVIGAIEPIYILPIKAPFYARVDTGAETSSIDVDNLTNFERDGEKWVSFDITSKASGQTEHFEKKVKKRVAVRRINEYEHRKIVEMRVKFGGETFDAQFSLADRSDFDYQALIGRNILMGRAIVDVSAAKTLH